jgi:rare lipoprotein A (peptidoglycan hydrolase)
MAGSKSVLRTVLACAVLAGTAVSTAASAAEVEFAFQPEAQVIDLGSPQKDRWGFRRWDDESPSAVRPLFGKNGIFARRHDAKPAVEAVSSVNEAYFPSGLQQISLSTPVSERTGQVASYGADFDGRLTTTGERFDMYRLTAASADLPLNSFVTVKNVETGETVTVRINDRKPAANGEMLTLSMAAANRLGLDATPGATVQMRYLGETAPGRVAPIQVASR